MDFILLITYTHIGAGIISLVAAPIAMIVLKGGRSHRTAGIVFFWAMTWIFISAIFLSVYKYIPFLLMIATFSYYSVIVGYRSIYQKHFGKGIKWYDWFALFVSGVFNIGFNSWGGYNIIMGQLGFFAYLSVMFGVGGVTIVIGQLKSFTRPSFDKHRWLYSHIGNMTGGFIASVTAFSTQVMVFMPGVIQWLWPSIIGVPLIFFWISSYRRKLTGSSRLTDLVELKR
ncbi:MAG: hypothetical protein RH948_13355 [Cyclobacteriaceae bacterium]